MGTEHVPDNFYDQIKPSLVRRIGRELRVARHVLDLGCGSCDLVEYLAQTYGQQVTGVDISSGAFPKQRRPQRGTRFRCIREDAAKLTFAADRSVDAVVMVWALHEMSNPESVLAETRRVLRPGGEILIVDFSRGSLAQKLWNENYYAPGEVKNLLAQAGFVNAGSRLIERRQVIWAKAFRPAAEGGEPAA